MSAKLVLSTAADADLAAILDYSIERFGRDVAEDYVGSFERAFDLLRRHPLAGALRDEVDPPIRCLPHRSHRVFYDVAADAVIVQRVLHHAMDVVRRLR